MPHIFGADRSDVLLFPEALDDYMSDSNPVRFVDAFVDNLDLVALGFTHATPAETGRPAYAPADPLRLYIYGHLNRVRSAGSSVRLLNYTATPRWRMTTG